MKILVTGYENSDLDGTACTFAYAEFLQKTGKNASAAVFGKPHREAQFVLKKFSITSLKNAEKIINNVDGIILVDASDLRGISEKINPEKVIEIIDHRKIHEAHRFPNAKVQVELVGSAATLIAEKFHTKNIPISKESAALLFSAIVSNTINFQANVTTDRDHKMANWLKNKLYLPENYVHEMFADKSKLESSWGFINDLATFHFNNYDLGAAQLEIINVDKFITKNLSAIKRMLQKTKQEKSLNLIFLTCIDLEKASNTLVAIDEETQKVLERALRVKFEKGVAKRDGILMRKEIIPLVKDLLE